MEGREWQWVSLAPKGEAEPSLVASDEQVDEDGYEEEEDPEERRAKAAAKALVTWTGRCQRQPCVKRHLTAERAAAAGVDVERYFDADGSQLPYRGSNSRRSRRICKAVRRGELKANVEQAQSMRAAEAQRKRVRRIEEGKEDRDALRELASSRDCDFPLEATPAGLRETAVDGTPRSAKAAGAQVRKLTQTFYDRLLDPRFYGVAHEELKSVHVRTEFWDRSVPYDQHWENGVRPLKRYGGKPTRV